MFGLINGDDRALMLEEKVFLCIWYRTNHEIILSSVCFNLEYFVDLGHMYGGIFAYAMMS